jgi:outer membrane protein assembly factor BamB
VGWLAALVCASLLSACSSDKPKPTALDPLTPKIAGRVAWQAKLTGAQFPMRAATRDGAFIVAGDDGTVLSLEAATGRELWRAQVGSPLAAGVGTDGRFTSVVTRSNEVVVLEQGRVLWRSTSGIQSVSPGSAVATTSSVGLTCTGSTLWRSA